eukprot:TRINITY_DN393_c0_g1_i4.p1 TRINITY_DN393_c0_g1~~TRINITY_DN393_c0_g1_i4.p1  ORF type:complete len:323 (-),score=68.55 TRINITY_DN393_c0_g1_i4:317-1144(-)
MSVVALHQPLPQPPKPDLFRLVGRPLVPFFLGDQANRDLIADPGSFQSNDTGGEVLVREFRDGYFQDARPLTAASPPRDRSSPDRRSKQPKRTSPPPPSRTSSAPTTPSKIPSPPSSPDKYALPACFASPSPKSLPLPNFRAGRNLANDFDSFSDGSSISGSTHASPVTTPVTSPSFSSASTPSSPPALNIDSAASTQGRSPLKRSISAPPLGSATPSLYFITNIQGQHATKIHIPLVEAPSSLTQPGQLPPSKDDSPPELATMSNALKQMLKIS